MQNGSQGNEPFFIITSLTVPIIHCQLTGLLNHQANHKPQSPQATTESIKCPCITDQGTLYQLCSMYGPHKKVNMPTATAPVKIPIKLGKPPRTRMEINNTTRMRSITNPMIIGVVILMLMLLLYKTQAQGLPSFCFIKFCCSAIVAPGFTVGSIYLPSCKSDA